MLTIQYTGKAERTVGGLVVYPGELLTATPNLFAAWQAEHGDVFVVVQGDVPPAQPTASEPEEAETPVEPKAKRK